MQFPPQPYKEDFSFQATTLVSEKVIIIYPFDYYAFSPLKCFYLPTPPPPLSPYHTCAVCFWFRLKVNVLRASNSKFLNSMV